MRTYGRIDGQWVVVTTDANGYNENVYLTALCQELKLQVNESPFYADHGIDVSGSLMQQIFPEYWMMQIQQRYAQYFASLKIEAATGYNVNGSPQPVYNVKAICFSGAILTTQVAT